MPLVAVVDRSTPVETHDELRTTHECNLKTMRLMDQPVGLLPELRSDNGWHAYTWDDEQWTSWYSASRAQPKKAVRDRKSGGERLAAQDAEKEQHVLLAIIAFPLTTLPDGMFPKFRTWAAETHSVKVSCRAIRQRQWEQLDLPQRQLGNCLTLSFSGTPLARKQVADKFNEQLHEFGLSYVKVLNSSSNLDHNNLEADEAVTRQDTHEAVTRELGVDEAVTHQSRASEAVTQEAQLGHESANVGAPTENQSQEDAAADSKGAESDHTQASDVPTVIFESAEEDRLRMCIDHVGCCR